MHDTTTTTPYFTLADHAIAWARATGRTVPERGTPEWRQLYEEWHAYAFADLSGKGKEARDA